MTGDSMHPPEFAGFLEQARQGRLAFPRCRACGQFHWYPMPRCPHCQADEIDWTPVSGRGEVFSYTIVRHPFDKRRRENLPYIVALVTFPDAPEVRFITNIVGDDAEDVRIGDAVAARFPMTDAAEPIVVFDRVKEA